MAMKNTPKTRNILVRNLSNHTSIELDKFKEAYRIKTDAKAVVHAIGMINLQAEIIEDLKSKLELMTNKKNWYWSILTELREGQNSLTNFDKEE